MRRLVFAIIVGLLALSASGATSLIVTEPCRSSERAGEDDGACPPTCVTCGCCAQPAESVAIAVEPSGEAPVGDIDGLLPPLPKTEPRDILHVPKPRPA